MVSLYISLFFTPPRCEVLTSGGLHYYIWACWCLSSLSTDSTCLQKIYRLSAGTLAPVLFQLGSYQCVWWVVIRRNNMSGSWPSNYNGVSITAKATLQSHSQQPVCPWNGKWDWSGKIRCPVPSNDEFGQPCPHSIWSHSFFLTLPLYFMVRLDSTWGHCLL